MNQGEIPFTTVGKQRRILESDLENYLKKNYKKLRGSIL
jgi:excisionase family DNA binding protein